MTKLIVFDLDNTLAKPGKGIEPIDILKLKKLEEKGIKIAIASGKTVDYLTGLLRQVELKDPILLGENGGKIQVGMEWPPQTQYTLPYSQTAREVLAYIKKQIDAKLPGIWYQPNLIAVSPFPSSEEEFDVIADILKENEDCLQDIIVFRHADCYDLVPKGIDKKAGVKFLAEKMGLVPEEIIAVGDGENDYPMFEYAGMALGVNVKDETKVDKNFGGITEVLDVLNSICEENEEKQPGKPETEDWATLAREDMEEFIELQGVYLRQ